MSAQASITVDIKAQISNLKDVLSQMQKEIDKLDIGSALGRSLKKEADSVEKQLENLSKNANVRITSEGGIESLTNKIGNVISRIQELGDDMQKVSFNDINAEVLENELKAIKNEWQSTKNLLEEKINLGVAEEIEKAPKLKKYLEGLGVDLKNFNTEQAQTILADNLEKAQEAAKKAKEELDELKNKYQEIKQQSQDMNADNSFYSRLKDSLSSLEGRDFSVEKVLNVEAIQERVEKWKGYIDELNGYTDQQKRIFKETIDDFFRPDLLSGMDREGVLKAYVEDFKNSFKDIFLAIGGENQNNFFDIVFGSRAVISASDIKKLFHLDPQAIEEGKKILSDTLAKFSPEELKTKKIQTLLDSNDITKAAEETIKLLREKFGEASEEAKKLQEQLADTLTQTRSASARSVNANRAEAAASDRYKEFLDEVKILREQNAQLEEKVRALEERIGAGTESLIGNIRKAGQSGKQSSGIELEQAAKNANLYRTELEQVQAREKLIGKVEGVVQRWFSIYAAVRMVGNAIRSVISTVKELDQTITEIAIVTDMTQNDLWGQMKDYTDMARQYASSISGVYKVSQLYYQQGLETADVMELTEQTLKMARISGLDYAEATNYMTNAIRSFKMEMTDAQRVVDVYSAIAASSATSTSELAGAMSKTASSAAAVGSSFENTTAMMAVMIEATRESAENIGSALKSIISRLRMQARNYLNCWKLLRVTLTTAELETINANV